MLSQSVSFQRKFRNFKIEILENSISLALGSRKFSTWCSQEPWSTDSLTRSATLCQVFKDHYIYIKKWGYANRHFPAEGQLHLTRALSIPDKNCLCSLILKGRKEAS